MKAVVVDVFNGEGYSEPTVTVLEKDSKEMFEAIETARLSYGDSFEESEGAGEENYKDVVYSFEGEEDSGAIHVIDLLIPEKVYIIHVQPDECKASIYGVYDTMEEAKSQLVHEMNKESNAYDIDDIEDYDGEDVFSSHGNDGFDYFQIIQG